jgi:hypothetical protein
MMGQKVTMEVPVQVRDIRRKSRADLRGEHA